MILIIFKSIAVDVGRMSTATVKQVNHYDEYVSSGMMIQFKHPQVEDDGDNCELALRYPSHDKPDYEQV